MLDEQLNPQLIVGARCTELVGKRAGFVAETSAPLLKFVIHRGTL